MSPLLPHVVVVKLSADDLERPAYDVDRADRHALEGLIRLPARTRVRVQLGARTAPTAGAVHLLHDALSWVDVQLEGTADAVAAWGPAVASGDVFGGVADDD